MSCAPISSDGRTKEAPEQKDGTDPDIQQDCATRSCGLFCGWFYAKGCKESGGVERLGNMFSLTSKDIDSL
jgi:hypothetical protein